MMITTTTTTAAAVGKSDDTMNGDANDTSSAAATTTAASLIERRVYRPCPTLSHSQLMKVWDGETALSYLFQYHTSKYNEQELVVDASSISTDPGRKVFSILLNHPRPQQDKILSTFLLFWMAWLTNGVDNDGQQDGSETNDDDDNNKTARNGGLLSSFSPSLVELTQYILETVATNDVSLSHRIELLAMSLDNQDLIKSCQNVREFRQRNPPVNSIPLQELSSASTSDQTTRMAILDKFEVVKSHSETDDEEHEKIHPPPTMEDQEQPSSSSSTTKKSRSGKGPRLLRIFRKKKKKNKKKGILPGLSSSSSSSSPIRERPTDDDDDDVATANKDINHKIEEYTVDDKVVPAVSPTPELSPTTPPIETSSVVTKPFQKNQFVPDELFCNLLRFLDELESMTVEIEQSLMKTFSQKFARWALQPWTQTKETALAQVTHTLREHLKRCSLRRLEHTPNASSSSTTTAESNNTTLFPMIDPTNHASSYDRSRLTMSVFDTIDANGCFILPSAHFPLLLTFESNRRDDHQRPPQRNQQNMYRTVVELVELNRSDGGSRAKSSSTVVQPRTYVVHGCIGGSVEESQRSSGIDRHSTKHVWDTGNILVFETRSQEVPTTLSVRVTEMLVDAKTGEDKLVHSDSKTGKLSYKRDCGFGWVDLTTSELMTESPSTVTVTTVLASPTDEPRYDDHGDLIEDGNDTNSPNQHVERIEVVMKVTTKLLSTSTIKRSLLYKHDDDLRQELFAIEFIKLCDRILKACGLDLKMITFECLPVGKNRGFIEWVDGSVPLSEICQQPFGSADSSSFLGRSGSGKQQDKKSTFTNNQTTARKNDNDGDIDDDDKTLSSVARAGLAKYETLRRVDAIAASVSLATSGRTPSGGGASSKPISLSPSSLSGPIQDFFRSFAYDATAPYQIKRHVMDRFVKSCAGYTVCTYLLGVGDRHLDNLLLHPSGYFFHCDYSFVLGQDPKKYLPMRITKEMVDGMGGRDSDMYCQFMNLVSATFLTLRRPENVRALLSLVRVMYGSGLPDLEETQSNEMAMTGLRNRMQLHLNDDDAISYIESLVHESCTSKMWFAVDAIHSLGKRF